jgi:PAP2 superfamily
VPDIGIVDTAVLYHQSVYQSSAGMAADALSAMPSVHAAWALFVAVCALRVTTSPWRYLGVAHAALTIWVVVVTGNHYWADAFVAAALLALTLAAQRSTRVLWARASPRWQVRVQAWSSAGRWGVRPSREGGGDGGGRA